LAEDQASLASIRTQVQSGELNADQASAKRAEIAADSAHLAGIIRHEQEQEKNFIGAGKQLNQSTRSYTRQLNDLHNQIASLTAQKDALDQAMSASS
jgi:chromosome segregation ATPase